MPSKTPFSVYLSGPITGRSRPEIESWRETATRQLKAFARVIDPAAYEYDETVAYTHRETARAALNRFQQGTFVVKRNKLLIRRSDVVLANFLGSFDRVSIGSVGELFIADVLEKPIILVREKQGNIHDHAMVNGLASTICHSLEEALEALAEMTGRSERIRSARPRSSRAERSR